MSGPLRTLLALAALSALVPLSVNEWRRLLEARERDAQVARNVAAARRALVDGRPEDALLAMRAARTLDPLDLEGQRGLREAEVRVLVDAPDRVPREIATGAAHFIQQELPNMKGEDAARYLVALGNAAVIRGDPEPARWYRRALEADPKLPVAHYHLGRALLDEGRPDMAEEHLRRALDGRGHDPGVARALGLVYAARGRWARAAELLSAVPRQDREVLAALGRAWIEQKKYTVAAEALGRALPGAPREEAAELHALLGRARGHLQQYEAAVASYEQAIKLAPQLGLRLALADTWLQAGELGRAEHVYAALLQEDLGVGEAHVGVVRVRSGMGDRAGAEEAAARFRASLRAYPSLKHHRAAVEEAARSPRR